MVIISQRKQRLTAVIFQLIISGSENLNILKRAKKVKAYIKELEAKRKEILDAGKDTADDTYIPTLEDILDDASYWFDVENGEYFNSWGVTDNYDADGAICLILGEDIEIK